MVGAVLFGLLDVRYRTTQLLHASRADKVEALLARDLAAFQPNGLTNRRMRTRMSGGVRGGGATPPPTRFQVRAQFGNMAMPSVMHVLSGLWRRQSEGLSGKLGKSQVANIVL
jgi:hypothetical protein